MTIFKGYLHDLVAYRVDGTDLDSKDKDALQIFVTIQFISEGDIQHFIESDGENINEDRIYRQMKKLKKVIENYKIKLPETKVKISPPDQPNTLNGQSS